MSEQTEYKDMLEIPVNTCNITVKPIKRRKKKNKVSESIKEELIEKVNGSSLEEENTEKPENPILEEEQPKPEENSSAVIRKVKKKKKPFKFTVVSVELIVIGVLVAVIFLTNSLYTDSGINTFFKTVFNKDTALQTDSRIYSDFSPTVLSGKSYNEGVISLSENTSVYAPVDGIVSALSFSEGKYLMEITHNDNFKTVLTDLNFAYVKEGDRVYSNIPIGYSSNSSSMCFTDKDNAVIVNFILDGQSVIWQV